MKYALNVAEDGRILSATYEKYARTCAMLVDELPNGNIVDYRYVDNEYIYDPLPTTEPEPTTDERIATLEQENKLLTQQVDALSSQNDFQEELIVELANIVYA